MPFVEVARGDAEIEESPAPAWSGQGAARSRRSRLNERRAEIIRTFAELGFVDLLARSGLWQYAPSGLKARGEALGASEQPDRPARLRRALEQLGGAFVKLGQALSVRPDLLPPEYVAELQKLQDDVPPIPFEAVRQVVESELGRPLQEAFASFSPSPLGSASIGQVHAAELHDGAQVVVKVQRPEAPTLIDLDLELMGRASRKLAETGWAKDVDVVGTVAEFSEAVRSELDFTAEARNLDSFGEFFAEDDTVRIPAALWDYSSRHLLTETRLDGIALSRPDKIREAGGDVHRLIRRGVDAYVRMVFDLREFHSDPHPGNLLALPGDAIGFLDFGRVSRLSEHALDLSAECLMSLAQDDAAGVTDAVLEMTHAHPGIDRDQLRLEIETMMDRYAQAAVGRVVGPTVFSETLEIVQRHHLRMPSEYVMLFQTLGVLQGVVLSLDPETKLLDVMKPYIRRAALRRYTPERVGRDALTQARQYARVAARLPDALDGVLRRLALGEMGLRVKVDETQELLDRAEVIVDRFALTLLLSAMAIALALAAGQAALPPWARYAVNGLLLLVLLLAVWLFGSIVSATRRSRRRRRGGSGR